MKKLYPLWLLMCLCIKLIAQRPGYEAMPPKDENSLISTANRISYIYYEAEKFDSSFYYARMALKAAEEKNMFLDLYMARFNIIASLIRLKKMTEVQNEFSLINRRDILPQRVNLLTHYYVLLGNYQLALKNKAAAFTYYDTAKNFARKNQHPELLLHVYRNMAESFAAVNDYKTAYQHYKNYNQLLTDVMAAGERLGNKNGPLNKEALENDITYLNKANEIKKLKILQGEEKRRHLERENLLKDSLLEKEKLLNAASLRADSLHAIQLKDKTKYNLVLKSETRLHLLLCTTADREDLQQSACYFLHGDEFLLARFVILLPVF